MTKSCITSALGFELNGYFIFIEVDPAYPEEVPGLFEGDIDLQPGDNPLVSTYCTMHSLENPVLEQHSRRVLVAVDGCTE